MLTLQEEILKRDHVLDSGREEHYRRQLYRRSLGRKGWRTYWRHIRLCHGKLTDHCHTHDAPIWAPSRFDRDRIIRTTDERLEAIRDAHDSYRRTLQWFCERPHRKGRSF